MAEATPKKWKFNSQFLVAIQNNDVTKATKLLNTRKVDPDTKFSINSDKRPGICLCVEKNYIDMVQLLVRFGSSVNQTDSNGQSPLHISCEYGYIPITKLLLKNKADVHSKNSSGQTPFHLACKYNNIELVTLLMKHGADIHKEDNLGRTSLHYASFKTATGLPVLPLFIMAGVDPKRVDKHGNTAMHFAVDTMGANLESIAFLSKAYPWAATKLNDEKKTPLHILAFAARKDEEEVLMIILRGLKFTDSLRPPRALSPRTAKGHTPLHVAVLEKKIDLVRVFISAGAEVDTCDQLGRSPLDCAARDMEWVIVGLLLKAGATNRNLISEGKVLPHIRDDSLLDKFIAAMRPLSLKASCRRTICRTWGLKMAYSDKCPKLYRKYLNYLEL